MENNHTPTPYYVNRFKGDSYRITPHELGGPKEDRIADGIKSEANAAFIVRACNSHDALVEALSDLLEVIPKESPIWECSSYYNAVGRAEDALAQAKGDK